MDSKKRAISAVLIIAVLLLAVWFSRRNVQELKEPTRKENIAMKGEQQPPLKEKAPEQQPAPAMESVPEEQPASPEPVEAMQPEVIHPPQVATIGRCKPEGPAIAKKRAAAAPQGMVYVPGGTFTMGSPSSAAEADDSPVHQVCVSGFYIDKYEVTNAQFKQFADATGYITDAEKDAGSGDPTWRHPNGPESNAEDMPNNPVVCVSWADANAYAQWAGKVLPTEAEWEKAARGTDGRAYPWGNSPMESVVNVADKSVSAKWSTSAIDDGYKTAAPVGSFPNGRSIYGAEDMAGNVWEWCSDWWDSDYYKKTPSENPIGPDDGQYRVIRGGSWFYSLDGARTNQRMYFRPDGSSAAIGFRCVSRVD